MMAGESSRAERIHGRQDTGRRERYPESETVPGTVFPMSSSPQSIQPVIDHERPERQHRPDDAREREAV